MSALQQQIEPLVAGLPGKAGIAAANLTTGETFALNERELFPTASMIKIQVLFELFKQHAAGKLSIKDRYKVKREDIAGGSGILTVMDEGVEISLRDVGVLMMSVSDNSATNILIEILGLENINASLRAAGMPQTVLYAKLCMKERDPNLPKNQGTPADFVEFLTRLSRNELLNVDDTQAMLRIMRIQRHIDGLRRYLPISPYAEGGAEPPQYRIASKPGGIDGVRCESGLITTPKATYVLSVMTKELEDKRWSCENEGNLFICRVSKVFFDAWGAP